MKWTQDWGIDVFDRLLLTSDFYNFSCLTNVQGVSDYMLIIDLHCNFVTFVLVDQ
jgi:hypothetical protein